jgi:hypothetical protein
MNSVLSAQQSVREYSFDTAVECDLLLILHSHGVNMVFTVYTA